MHSEMKTMISNIRNLNSQTNNLLEMLKNLTGNAQKRRDSVSAGISGIEAKMKKAGFNLTEVHVCVSVMYKCTVDMALQHIKTI